MARSFPRFLFSNPQNTKSTGPFIVHLSTPKMICKVHERRTNQYSALYYPSKHFNGLHFGRFAIELLEAWDQAPSLKYTDIMYAMNEWLWKQIETGAIELPEPYDDRL